MKNLKPNHLLLGLITALFVFQSHLVLGQCAASFTYSPGANGLVTFISTSTGTSASTNYNWTFGPATFSATGGAGMNPSYTYTANGVYMVYLNLFSAVPTCSSNTNGVWINITNATNTCVLNAGFTYGLNQNNAVFFNNTTTGVSAGVSYTWNFGDGNSATGLQASHTYSANGIYNVTLTANNNYTAPCVSVYTANVNANTSCNYSANITSTLLPNGVVSIASNTTGTNPPNMYYWQYGDGTTGSGSALSAVQHTYYINGYYQINLHLSTTSPSCYITYTAGLTVTNVITPPCTVQANFNFNLGANGAVSFINTSTGTLASTSYNWDFGLGVPWSTSSANSPNYSYTNNQSYLVKLKATNNFSPVCVSTKTAIVTISNTTCNLIPSMQYTQMPNGVIGFTNTTTGGGGWTSYYWGFGDGSGNSSTVSASMQHTYSANGNYPVVATLLSTAPACTAAAYQIITVTTSSVNPCNLNPSFTFSAIGPGQFQFQSTSSGTTNASTYQWNFGNGIVSAQNPATVSFPSNGQYVVQLSVNNNTTPPCNASHTQTISVTNTTCLANSNFSMAPTNTAQVWYVTPSFPWNVSNAVWSWGDGSSSNGLYSSHTYSAAGNYQICLSVTVSCGSSASTCATYSISKMSAANAMIQINVVAPELVEVGIEHVAQTINGLNIYPNPNNGILNLELNSNTNSPLSLQVMDLNGKLVYDTQIENPAGQKTSQVNLQELPNSMYLLQFKQADQRLHKKLVITKD